MKDVSANMSTCSWLNGLKANTCTRESACSPFPSQCTLKICSLKFSYSVFEGILVPCGFTYSWAKFRCYSSYSYTPFAKYFSAFHWQYKRLLAIQNKVHGGLVHWRKCIDNFIVLIADVTIKHKQVWLKAFELCKANFMRLYTANVFWIAFILLHLDEQNQVTLHDKMAKYWLNTSK